MLAFVARRLLQAVPVVIIASFAIFLIIHLVPGDPAQFLAGGNATPQAIAAIRVELGLDRPLPIQYMDWAEHVVRGDLGRSYAVNLPISQLLGQRIPATAELALAAMLLVVLLSIPLGIVAALGRGGPVDWIITALTGVALAIPNFWSGILAIIVFALILGWLPAGGQGDFASDPLGALRHLILPAVTLAVQPIAELARQVKGAMLDSLQEDYVRTARSKGLPGRHVIVGHVLRNSLLPVVTLLGLQTGRLLGGAVIIESIFAWPGVGTLVLDAIGNSDYATVQATLLILVMVVVIVNLLTDLTYAIFDPRIRLSHGGMR